MSLEHFPQPPSISPSSPSLLSVRPLHANHLPRPAAVRHHHPKARERGGGRRGAAAVAGGGTWGTGQGMFGWKKWLILLEFTKLGGNIIVSFDGNFGKLRFLDDGMRSSTG